MSEAIRIQITDNDGKEVYGLSWKIDNPKGNVLIFEGMEEHSLRYDALAKRLNGEGFDVYCLDYYGQGQNVAPDLQNIGIWPIDGFNKMIDNMHLLINSINSNVPTSVFAHSMGSYVGQGFIQKYSNEIDRIILCGSGAKNKAVPIGLMLAKMITTKKKRNVKAKMLNNLMFGNFNKRIKEPRTSFDWLSYNTENVDTYIADPLSGFGPNNGFCLEFLKGMKKLYTKKGLNSIRKDLPIYIITGEEDPVTGYSKATLTLKKMYNKLGFNDVDTNIYKGMRHEICNETDKFTVFNDIANFFNK